MNTDVFSKLVEMYWENPFIFRMSGYFKWYLLKSGEIQKKKFTLNSELTVKEKNV